jgi:alpha-amylase
MNLVARRTSVVLAFSLFSSLSALAATPKQQQGGSTAILFQGFHWNSPGYTNWYQTLGSKAADLKDLGVTHVWFPPVSDSADANGYLPRQLNVDQTNAITAFRNQGLQAVADIVINHRVGTNSWADFTNPTWSCTAVTADDEWYNNGGSCGQRGVGDTGNGYSAGRDLDHYGTVVQTGVKTWLTSVKNLGYTGLRYDYAMGYRAAIQGTYTNSVAPDFCVDEIWTTLDLNNVNAHRQIEMNYVSGDGSACASNNPTCGAGNGSTCGTFDFTTHGLLVQVLNNNDYWRLRDSNGAPQGAIGWWPAMQVTFVDNHDTGPAESCGSGQNLWSVPCGSVMQAYAYILTHPGIPTIFYPHVYNWNLRAAIKALVQARKSAGVTSTSTVSIQQATTGLYAAIIQGTTHKLAMKLGPNSWSPAGAWTLLTSGNNYAVWQQ